MLSFASIRSPRGRAVTRVCAGFPPIAAVLTVTAAGADYLPLTASVLGLGGIGYAMIKHRAFVGKAFFFILRKITRSKR